MMLIYLGVALALIAVIYAGYRNFKLMRSELTDAEMLEVMETQGADMNIKHRFDFFMEFTNTDDAEKVRSVLGDAMYQYELDDEDEGTLMMSAYLNIIPTEANIKEHATRVENACEGLGTYHDWSYEITGAI